VESALAERLASLPARPGVYLMKNARGKVLYVGKAQSLRSRVRSYFGAGGGGNFRAPRLLREVAEVSVLVTPSVKEALLLENELIKQHKPGFNVRLRDDKQYLGLRLDLREDWPRLRTVRRFKNDGALYFGPYTSSAALKHSLSNLRKLFPLRSCSDGVFRDYARRGRPCIEYEMKRCPGPCCGLAGESQYAELLRGTELFLRGRSRELLHSLQQRMSAAAAAERFEEAAQLRDRIAGVEQTIEQQQIIGAPHLDRDVFALARRAGEVQLQILHIREGRVIGAAAHSFSGVEVGDAAVLASFLGQFYAGAGRQAPAEVLVSLALDDDGALAALLGERAGRAIAVRVPRRGAPRRLLEMALNNAELALSQRIEARQSLEAAIAELRERLRLSRPPRRIECYDVSNLQGTLAVASRVAFEDGRPHKNGYRRYRIRQAAAGDDLACLREVLERRLARRESEPLPDLLVVDGGRGQLGVASALLGDLGIALDHIGLAKEREGAGPAARVKRSGGLKAERIFLPGRKNPVLLPPSSRGMLLLQRVRDEAHRFAIEFQRALRNKAGLTSILDEIPGIGPQKRRALLRSLGSLRRVREAHAAELSQIAGLSERDAHAIHSFFRALDEPAPES